MTPVKSLIAAATFLSLGLSGANAEQRALLVGVGKYAMPGHDLPGIDLDLQTMQETLNLLGFEDRQIMTLLDEQATAANVEQAMRTWLRDGVGPADRVVFYYSGHGSYVVDENGDESDGSDEVLVTHDVHTKEVNGRASLAGVILDDDIAEIIETNPSKNIWTIIDACHSGTATRNFSMDNLRLGADPVFSRTFTYPGMPTGDASVVESRARTRSLGSNFVSISAADDGEQALGNSHGGFFTIGFSKAIWESAQAQRNVTVTELRDRAAAYIEANVDEEVLYHPRVTGSPALANGALPIVPLEDGNGPNWKRLVSTVEQQPGRFPLGTPRSTYPLGEPVEIEIDVPISGYLNVVTVDSQDNAVVLFPNQYHADNRVEPGRFVIPTANMTFELPASEPVGPTLVVGFVTRNRVNFYEQALDGRDLNGVMQADFTLLSPSATRAIKVTQKTESTFAAQTELIVTDR